MGSCLLYKNINLKNIGFKKQNKQMESQINWFKKAKQINGISNKLV